MDYNADWYPGCTLDPDWQDRDNHYDNAEERVYDRVTETFQSSANDNWYPGDGYTYENVTEESLEGSPCDGTVIMQDGISVDENWFWAGITTSTTTPASSSDFPFYATVVLIILWGIVFFFVVRMVKSFFI